MIVEQRRREAGGSGWHVWYVCSHCKKNVGPAWNYCAHCGVVNKKPQ